MGLSMRRLGDGGLGGWKFEGGTEGKGGGVAKLLNLMFTSPCAKICYV
jgi:hypothetical protein